MDFGYVLKMIKKIISNISVVATWKSVCDNHFS